MDRKIGSKLLELRKKKGLTQDQLAEQLGVSAPAVSKWETDSSYPDITLLCPLARALDTNVDTLLQFEETLSTEEVIEKVNAVVETARTEGYKAGEKMLTHLLHEFPNSVALKYNAAVAWDVFTLLHPNIDEETLQVYRTRKKELLTEVRASGNSAYWQTATMNLATMAIQDDQLDKAERLLKELPEHNADATLTWSLLYRKKKQPEEALKITQKRLYSLVRQAQTCLTIMLNPELVPDDEQQLEICETYKTVDDLFGLNSMYDGLFLGIYLRMNHIKEAAECLDRYVDVLLGNMILPKKYLFSPGLDIEKSAPASGKELRQMLLKGLEKDPQYQTLLQYPKGKRAVERLRASVK